MRIWLTIVACVFGLGCGGSDDPVCGDGLNDTGEQCDDGNSTSGDGCSAACTVEDGFECAVGDPSVCTSTCGDGIVSGPEECDDDGTDEGDGCSATCTVETGWSCFVGNPSLCMATCGNGVVDGAEACDDNNLMAGDGCTGTCVVEAGWSCMGSPSVCDASCGDGEITGGEQCDDGAMAAGDGCSESCAIEAGWECAGTPSTCSELLPELTVLLNGEVVASGDANAPFDNLDVGDSDTAIVTLVNGGVAPLTVSASPTGDAADFALDMTSLTIETGDLTNVVATFEPTNGGLKRVAFALTTNDPLASSFDLRFSGHTTPNHYRDLSPTTPPSARFNTSLVDLGDGRVLLFGGRDATGAWLSDTWTYDIETNAWTELTPAMSPSARNAHAMALADGVVVLFGGTDVRSTPATLTDTWVFDITTNEWSEVMPPTSPPARFQHNMVSLGGGRVLLYGGQVRSLNQLDDTWIYNVAANTWTDASPSVSPTGRHGYALGFDGSEVIMVGGAIGSTPVDETWTYDLTANRWTEQTGSATTPGARFVHEGAYFEESGLFIMHSGKLNSCCVNPTAGTFAWNPVDDEWTVLTPSSEPPARFNYGFAYIRGTNKAIVFGGVTRNTGVSSALATTYEYVGPTP